jgi:hypothetical protein
MPIVVLYNLSAVNLNKRVNVLSTQSGVRVTIFAEEKQ